MQTAISNIGSSIKITSITINVAVASSGGGKYILSAGTATSGASGTAFSNTSNGDKTYNITTDITSGNIVISLQSTTNKAMYIKSVTIGYADVGGGCSTLSAPGSPSSTAYATSVDLSWNSVANSSGYLVTFDGTEYNIALGTTTKTITGLKKEKTYAWTVAAKGDGSTYCALGTATSEQSVTTLDGCTDNKVTYTVASTSSVTPSGAPGGTSASYSSTYGTLYQLTGGNSMTLTLSGYAGKTIKGLTLDMRSNGSAGAGTFSMVIGSTTVASIASATNFNEWYDNDSYGTDFRKVHVTLSDEVTVGTGESIVITIAATTNSLYCQGFALCYSTAVCGSAPTVSNGSLKGSVSSSSVEVQCTDGITNIGGAGCSLTSYGFAVGTSSNPTIGGTLTGTGKTYEVGSSIAVSTGFDKVIDGLSASTTYHVRSYATNGAGTNYGADFTITTSAACTAAPTVTTGSTGTITGTTAAVTCASGLSSLGTGGCAISSYGFVYGTSSNPTTSNSTTEVGTSIAASTSFNTTLTGLTEGTLYYVRPYATNGYGTGYGTQVSFGTPKITVSQSSRAFGDRAVGGSYEMTFTVEGVYLQGNISIAKSGANQAMFSIDNATVTQTDGTAPTTTITVTYSPSTAGSHSATLTLSSTNATNKTVSLSGIGKWTVTFLNGNGGTHSTSLVANSTAPSKPNSDPAACDANSTTFMGWTQTAWSGKQNQSFIDGRTAANVKVYTSSDNLPAMTSDMTYYPVYAKGTETSTPVANTWTRITSTSQLTDGATVLLVQYYSDYAINTTPGATSCTANAEITNSTANLRWTAVQSSSKWKFKSSSNHYLSTADLTNGTAISLDGTYDEWTISADAGGYSNCFNLNNGNDLEYYSSVFKVYAWSAKYASAYPFYIYIQKTTTTTTYSDYLTTCCTELGTINGSIKSISGTSATLKWDNLSGVDGTTPYTVTVSPSAGTSVGAISTVDGYKNCTVSGLTAGTAYTFTINAFGDASHCDASQEVAATTPKITLGSASGTSIYIEGDGPGSKQTFTVTAVGLTGNLTVTAPTNFAVCATENGTYQSNITLTPTSGAVSTTVYFQLVADKTAASSPYAGSVTVSGGSATEQTVAVNGTVSPACENPTINTQPAASASYNLNVTATALSVVATKNGTGPALTYQWYSNTANSKTTPTPTLIGGATSASYTPPTTATGTKYYFCEVSSGACAVTTNISAITINTPSITVSKTSIAFGDQAKDGSHTETFTVTGTNLASSTGLTLAVTGSSYFTIDKTSVAQTSSGAVSETTITVTYAPTVIGNDHSATITISSTGATNKTVTLSGNSKYKITWVDQAANPATESYTYVASGKPTFPSNPSGGCDSYTYFYGWAEGSFTTPVTAPTSSSAIKVYKAASEMPNVSGNVTYYAVWADSPGGWSKETSSIAANDVIVIVNETNTKEIKSVGNTNTSVADTAWYTSTPRGVYELTVKTGNQTGTFAFQNGSDYLTYSGTATSGSNYLWTTTSITDDSSWGVSFDGDGNAIITSYAANNKRYIRYNSGQPRFACYYSASGTPSQNPVQIYKKSAAGNCVTKCCTDLGDIHEGVKDATLAYNGMTIKWDDISGVSSWSVTGKNDDTDAAVAAGNIGTPSDAGSTYECVISNLDQYTNYTFTITGTPTGDNCPVEVTVSEQTPCVAPSSLSIASTGNKWDFCAGETMTLTLSGSNISGSATYQWKKWNGSSWDNIAGANSASYSTTMAAAKAGQYCCTVTNPGSGSCATTSGGVWVRLWQLHLGDDDYDFTNNGTGTGENTAVHLNSDTHYEFKLINNNGGWFGKNSTTITSNTTDLELAGDLGLANVNITSGLEGNYTFAIDYSDKDNPTISVTYPTADQPNNRDIWFDKSVVDGWGNGLYYRIGSETWHKNNTKAGGTAWTLVPGTDNFYTTKTMTFDGFVAWTISNNSAWCADEWDNHSIYGNATDGYKITKAIDFQKYVVGASGVTIVPTAYHNTDANSCDYWNVSKTDGMLKHTATITSYSHGTVTVAYTKYDGTGAASFTTGSNDDLAHRCILTITAVPDAGYNLTSLQVNGANFTSGNTHILSADATITAVFSPKTTTVTFDKNSGTGGDNGTTATYDAAMTTITPPTRSNYNFGGYFDAETDNNGSGTKYYNTDGTSAKVWDKTDATATLYAQWTGDTYNITYKDQGNVAYSGSNAGSLVDTHTYGAATVLVAGEKTGYHFDGWFTTSACTGDPITSVGASAFTANFTLYAKWTIENYTVTWMVNGDEYTTGTPTGNADYNTKVSTLPTAPSAPEGCSDKVFKGWSASNLGKTTGQSAPADLFTTAGGSPTITDDVIFYAVFADETPESSTTTWTKTSNTSDLTTGTYAILTHQLKAFTGSISSGHGAATSTAFSFTDNVATSTPDGMLEVTITRVAANQFRISRVVDVEGVPTTEYLHATKCQSGGLAWSTETGSNYWYNNSTGYGIRYSVKYTYNKVETNPYMLSTTNDTPFRTSGNDGSNYLWFAKKGSVVTPASWSNYVTLCDAPAECGTPTFSVDEDTYTETQSVTISTTTPGATIRYTTDGTDPTSSSGTVYSEPVEISCTTTLKAIAYKAGREDSEVGSVDITIKVPDPTFSVNSGTYYAVQNVTLSCDMDGATIYYETTNDGTDPSTPTSSSTEYTGAINIPANSTIKVSAIAIKDGCATASDVVTKTYVVRVGTNYTLVTDVNDLNEGDKVVIVADNGSTRNAVNSYAGGNDRPSTNDFDFANNEKTVVTVYPLKVGDSYTVQVFELQGGPGAWVFKAVTDDTKKYLGLKDDNNYLKTYTADDDDQTKWTISISTGIAHIANKQRTTRYIEYNSTGSKFACYTSNQTARTKIYSVPNPDPVIKVEGTLSAFAGCTSEASAAQSFYVSGKNLSASIRVAAPTGYEVSLSSGSGYADYIDVVRVGTAVAKTQIYVRIKTGQSVGSPSGNVVVSVSEDELSKNVVVSGTVSAADTYIDQMHGNSTTYQCGSYSAPDLDNGDMETGTDCQKNYAIFQGWAAASDINLDGTLKAGATVISDGTAMTASGTTYYSVWEAVDE